MFSCARKNLLLRSSSIVVPAGGRRLFAEDASKAVSVPNRGAGLFARIGSFLIGAGLTALVTQFYIFAELRDGNKIILQKQKEIEKRLKKLEGN